MPETGQSVTPQGSSTRTGAQGLSVAAILELLTAFNAVNLTGRQTAAVMVVGTAAASLLMRLVEAKIGKAWLRTVGGPQFP